MIDSSVPDGMQRRGRGRRRRELFVPRPKADPFAFRFDRATPPASLKYKPKTYSLVHPARGRPVLSGNCIETWVQRCSTHNKLEYVLSLDADDAHNYLPLLTRISGKLWFSAIISTNQGVVDALNHGARHATGDVLIYVSDDFEPPELWDLKLDEVIGDLTDFVVWVNDGIQLRIMTISIVSRKYYEREGHMYYPEYFSVFCDNDFTEKAKRQQKIIMAQHLTFQHNHPCAGRATPDATYKRSNADKNYLDGETTFTRRWNENFGLSIS